MSSWWLYCTHCTHWYMYCMHPTLHIYVDAMYIYISYDLNMLNVWTTNRTLSKLDISINIKLAHVHHKYLRGRPFRYQATFAKPKGTPPLNLTLTLQNITVLPRKLIWLAGKSTSWKTISHGKMDTFHCQPCFLFSRGRRLTTNWSRPSSITTNWSRRRAPRLSKKWVGIPSLWKGEWWDYLRRSKRLTVVEK